MRGLSSSLALAGAMSIIGSDEWTYHLDRPKRFQHHPSGIWTTGPSKAVRQKRKAQRLARKIERRNRK